MKSGRFEKKSFTNIIAAVLLWLIAWQAASVLTGLDLILASPVSVFLCLKDLMLKSSTYLILWHTFMHITIGFLCAFAAGIACACLAHRNSFVKTLLVPPLLLMKSLPMASFIILLLIWFGSGRVSAFTSFIVTFPLVYSGFFSGIDKRDREMLEVAQVYGISVFRRICRIDIREIFSIAKPDIKMAAGMCMKAGVSAEVIGLARRTVGEQLYYSKIYLDTAGLFAWSLLVVVLGFLWEKLFVWLLECAERGLRHI